MARIDLPELHPSRRRFWVRSVVIGILIFAVLVGLATCQTWLEDSRVTPVDTYEGF